MIALKETVIIVAIGILLPKYASESLLDMPHPPVRPSSPYILFSSPSINPQSSNIKPLPCTTISANAQTGARAISTIRKWQNFNVQLDPMLDQREYQLINDALWQLQKVLSCIIILIWPANLMPTGDYVRIAKGETNGCNSHIGRIGGAQIINLQSPGCMDLGTIIHEFMHALGIYHEHVRSDRDNYVIIRWANIIADFQHNFEKLPPSEANTFGVPYDVRSIMHYRSTDFSINGQPTIQAKNGAPIGSMGQLQYTDIRKLRLFYGCT